MVISPDRKISPDGKYTFLALLIAIFLLMPFLLTGTSLIPENEYYRKTFSAGPYNPVHKNHSFVWLNHYNFGTPRAANPLLINYYPVSYLNKIIKQPYFDYLLWITALVLGIMGAYKLFGLFTENKTAAFTAGVLFALSGIMFRSAMIGLLVERIPLTAWTLFLVVKGVRDNRRSLLAAAAFIHGVHFYICLTSYIWFYLSAAIAFYIAGYEVYRFFTGKEKHIPGLAVSSIINGLVFFIPAGLITALLLLPVSETMQFICHRFEEVGSRKYVYSGKLRLEELFYFPFFFPGIYKTGRQFYSFINLSYLGILPLFFSFFYLFKEGIKKEWIKKVLLFCLVIFILQAAASLKPVDTFLRLLPPLRTLRYSGMWMVLWNLLFLILFVFGLKHISTKESLKKVLLFLSGFFIFMVFVFVYLAVIHFAHLEAFGVSKSLIDTTVFNPGEALRPFIVLSIMMVFVFLVLKKPELQKYLVPFILVLSIVDIFTWSFPIGLEDFKEISFKERIVSSKRDNNFNNRLFTTNRANPIGDGRVMAFGTPRDRDDFYGLLVDLLDRELVYPATSIPLKRGFNMAVFLGWDESYVTFHGQINRKPFTEYLQKGVQNIARSLNIKYYYTSVPLTPEQENEYSLQKSAGSPRGMYVYEDLKAFPRAVLYNKVKTVKTPEEALEYIKQNPDSLLSLAVVEVEKINPAESYDLQNNPTVSTGDIKVIKYSPTEVVLENSRKQKGLLFLSDIDYPGWTVYVDGKKEKIYKTNLVGRGVFLKKGAKTIRFVFYPKRFYAGLVLTFIGFLLTIGLLVFFIYKEKKEISFEK